MFKFHYSANNFIYHVRNKQQYNAFVSHVNTMSIPGFSYTVHKGMEAYRGQRVVPSSFPPPGT